MEEIGELVAKYDQEYISRGLGSPDDLNRFAATFYRDVSEIYDVLTRVKNAERNPTGFSLEDAPILGLLVRMWKLLKEIVRYYDEDNAEMVGLLDRMFLEAAVTAEYLMAGDEARLIDYRKCSYKHRLRMLREAREGSPFYESKAGVRLLKSIRSKMTFEGFTESDFQAQKKNRWRLEGKSFFDIFDEVHDQEFYAMTYGIMSESVHGSWNDSWDFDLVHNEDGSFSTFPFYQPADPRFVGPLIRYSVPAYRAWLKRIDAFNEAFERLLNWVEGLNGRIFLKFDHDFDGP